MEIKRVGIIGGGQLAAMMVADARKLNLELIIQTPNPEDPGAKSGEEVILASLNDALATAKLAQMSDIITFENEFIDLKILENLAAKNVVFFPSLNSLTPLLDKYTQRSYLQKLGLPVPWFVNLDQELPKLSNDQFPLVLKARRHGYDGQGTFIIDNYEELTATREKLKDTPLLIEEYIPFTKELAVMAARNNSGTIAIYPLVETQQEKQVCHRVIAPATVSPKIVEQVKEITTTILESLEYVGILGIEFFLTKTEQVLINEIAPRTHNSGHYTIDACDVSQFEMQLRAIANLPLPQPNFKTQGALMINLLGYEHSQQDYQTQRQQLAAIPHTFVHWYGKNQSHPGRKLGHVTKLLTTATEVEEVGAIAQQLESIWYVRKQN